MAKFKYSMQNVYNIKLKMEDQAKTQYAEAQAKLNEELDYLEVLKKRREAHLAEGVRLREATLNILDIKNNRQAVEKAEEYIAGQQARIIAARKNLDAAERRLNTARQERKMQEKLREKAFEEFKKEIEKEESKQIDELVSFRYGERAREEAARAKRLKEQERAEERAALTGAVSR